MEHIIPQWLLKMTGTPIREAFFGIHLKEIREIKFRFNSFVFPACTICNNDFSKLENEVKPVIEKVLNNQPLMSIEINLMLDWFDKIRIGLWLAFYNLNNNFAEIAPKFFIKDRIGARDRLLVIYKGENITDGINFCGVQFPLFQNLPSCFLLRINNTFFLNISKEFLFAKNIGFPYPIRYLENVNNYQAMKIRKGKSLIVPPFIEKRFIDGGFEIYQPIINRELFASDPNENDLYDNEFVRNHMLNWEEGKGAIFTKTGHFISVHNSPEELINIRPSKIYDAVEFFNELAIHTFEFQNFLLKQEIDLLSNFGITKEDKEYLGVGITFNEKIIELLSSQLIR
ncbi:hypothetical protein MKX70_15325 [Paenibacillus sp. FSL R7-0312]|uniref:hypothetical protein n=1 Tax=Paenibacillus sp. FSL R7-0312 TaxID=2921682 RepID=UPI0030F95FE6